MNTEGQINPISFRANPTFIPGEHAASKQIKKQHLIAASPLSGIPTAPVPTQGHIYNPWVYITLIKQTNRAVTNEAEIEEYSHNPLFRQVDVLSRIRELLDSISSLSIIIPRPAEIREYLLQHIDLTDCLASICHMARQQFKLPAELSLELYHDPEIDDKYLTLYIRQDCYSEQIFDQIDDLRSQYERLLIDKSGWIFVTTDFRPPRTENVI